MRTAVVRDYYADVPPTRGVFKGVADTDLTVGKEFHDHRREQRIVGRLDRDSGRRLWTRNA